VPIEFFGQAEEVINPLYSVELDALAEGFFAPSEVKVEVNELEPLPKVELLEDPVNTETRTASKRQGGQNDGSPHPKRRIKNEQPLDSDSDVPLADFLGSDSKSSSSKPARNSQPTKGRPLRRSTRRGRPPKAKPEPPASPKKEELDSDDEEDNARDNNDMEFVAAEAVLGTDDSGSSSSDSSAEDSDQSLPDIEPEERYAEIPKRVVVKPKKFFPKKQHFYH